MASGPLAARLGHAMVLAMRNYYSRRRPGEREPVISSFFDEKDI
jgi:hypothetical protein